LIKHIGDQMIQIFLSILLASATAYVLQVFATIPELDASSWSILTIITMIVIASFIIYLFNKPSSDEIAGTLLIIKSLLIFILTMALFAFARFVSFYFDNNIQILNVDDMYSWVWGLVLSCGILLGLCYLIEYLGDKKHPKHQLGVI
jgi:formate hydrogenlyase subunit 3/multisubunit Na+/H+ antiporter MnhD subunit